MRDGGLHDRTLLTKLTCALAVALAVPAAADAAFPGANGRIVYEGPGLSGSTNSSIFTMNPDGTGKTNLTPNPLLRGASPGTSDPAFSADGERIVFERVELGVNRPEIWVMNADGSGQTNLAGGSVTDRETDPSFSPDGSKIVYTNEPDSGDPAIYVMNADGTARTDLTSGLAVTFPGSPEFSPDGTKIAFDASIGGVNDVFVMNANGTGLTNLTSAVAGSSTDPSYSPDGSRIAFRQNEGMGQTNIFTIGTSGGATTNLTATLPAGALPRRPAYSPDGTRIAYVRTEGGDPDIFAMNSADGLGQTNLTADDPGDDSAPYWGPVDADAPDVAIGKGPKKRTSKRTAKLQFAADEVGVSFECKLSGKDVKKKLTKFKPCSSPKAYKRLKSGKKVFEVRGTDGAGNVGQPARFVWKIKGGK